MSEALSLFSLFASSFLSATLLPGNSEVVLVAMLLSGISHPWVLVLTATMGNSLGGLTNVILGRFFPLRKTSRWQEKATGWLKQLWCSHAIIKLDARGWRFTVSVSGMDAHLLGASNLFCALVKRYAMLQLQQRPFRA